MALTLCRKCKGKVSNQAFSCPHCGAPHPAREEWKGTGIDWKSETALFGFPLIHVAFGRNAEGKLRVSDLLRLQKNE